MKNFKPALITFVQGIVMGIAEIVPGISASTATLLLGIYDDFIELLSGVTDFVHTIIGFVLRKHNKNELIDSFKKINFSYGIKLFIGMVIGIVLFSNIVSYMYDKDEQVIKSIFFGIILASLVIPYKIVHRPAMADLLFFAAGFAVFFTVLNMHSIVEAEAIPLWLVFIGGSISVTGMVLPGVNSSFLLIPLGVYELILNIITEFSRFNFTSELILQLVVFLVGLGFGLITIVRILKFAFEKHVTKLFSLIGGIMIASLAGIWPFENSQENISASLIPIILIFVSTVLTFLFIKISKPEKEFESGK